MPEFNYTKRFITARPRSERLREMGVTTSAIHISSVATSSATAVDQPGSSVDVSALQSRVAQLEAQVRSLGSKVAIMSSAPAVNASTGVLRFYGFGTTPTEDAPILFDSRIGRFVFFPGLNNLYEAAYQNIIITYNPSTGAPIYNYYPYGDVLFVYNHTLYYYEGRTLKLSVPIAERNTLDVRDFYQVALSTWRFNVVAQSTVFDENSHIIWWPEISLFGLSKWTGMAPGPTALLTVYRNWDTREQWTDEDFKPYTNMIYRIPDGAAYIYTGSSLEQISIISTE